MPLPRPTRHELQATLRLAWPLVLSQLGWQMIGLVASLMAGRLGPVALAAVSIGNFLYFNVLVFGLGLLLALDPVISQAVGAVDREGVALGIQRGVIIAVGCAVVMAAVLWPAEILLTWLRQPADVVPLAARWVRLNIVGLLPLLLFIAGRQALQSMGRARPVVIATAVANVLHVVLSYALMFGRLGAPALGVEGSAYAMAASRWSMFLVLLWAGWPELKSTLRPWRDRAWEWAPMRRMLGLGAPLAAQYFFEAFAFGLVTIWAGWLGMTTLAGHEIALNLASVTFMVPLGVSGAGAALVGNAVGRGDQDGVRREAAAVLVLGVGFMGASALAFVLAPAFFAGLYTNDATTLAVALSLLPIAGAFQLFDGLQVVCGAILRGTGETRTPMLMHFLGFWGAGVPTSWWLGLHAGWGARGLWWGLVAGLVFAGALQFSRVIVRLKGPIARLNIDHPPLGH